MAFDAAGRLYVTQSIEYPWPATEGTPRDTIRVITDTDGDGVPDTVSKFATGLNIPIGVLPLAGNSVLAYNIPRIERFTDANADGVADSRESMFNTFGFDDTHGMASSFNWWLDGWVYGCHGFRNNSKVAGKDDEAITMNSGNTYRFRPDGSHIEYYTHGQVNPFGMAFDPLGNVYTADCHSRPIYMLLRGAYYPSFGKPHDGLGYGPEMIKHSHGSTGICGLVVYDATQFPDAYRNTVFIGNPVTGRINHDQLKPTGSTYDAVEQPDFVSCEDLWFRPVDIKLAPDGSMYVADFYNCIIGHYEVDLHHPRRDRTKGRIWRIVYTGDKARATKKSADLTKASAADLVAALGNDNIVVRTLATHQAVERLDTAGLDLVRQGIATGNPNARVHSLWVLERRGALSPGLIERLSNDPDRMVRVHLVKGVTAMTWKEDAGKLRSLLIRMLEDKDAFVRRAAADGLGQHPAAENVEPLLALWKGSDPADTHLVHTTRIALRDSLQSLESLETVTAKSHDNTETYRRLADVTVAVPTAAGGIFLQTFLASPAAEAGRVPEYLAHAARYVPEANLTPVVENAVAWKSKLDDGQQVAALRGIQQALQSRKLPLSESLVAWSGELATKLLASKNDDVLRIAADLARDFRVSTATGRLAELVAETNRNVGVRQQAIDALNALDSKQASVILEKVIGTGIEALPLRQRAADLLGSQGTPESRQALLRLLPEVPDPVGVAISRSLTNGKEGAAALLDAIATGKASSRLIQDIIVGERVRGHNDETLVRKMDELLADLPSEDDRVKQLVAARRESFGKSNSSADKGVLVFQKICANCHRVEGKGAKIGPDLDGIGNRGLERLLEDVLLPSRNVDQAFRTTVLELKSGKTTNGLFARNDGNSLVLVNEQGKEFLIAEDDIVERKTLRVSPMPANIAEQLGEEDFHHLVKYLLTLNVKPKEGAK
ncbi:MAG: HEAT repeat domain-containing protein, partial [Planctomycetota bacterium]|nr:HEAT repeat domain-containing protein [Planctomycetota bacterium]